MKTLVVSNQKGGVGKTATVVHLAYHMAQRLNLRVAVIDLDTQGNASFSLLPVSVEGGCASALFRSGFRCATTFANAGVMLLRSDAPLADMERVPLDEASANFSRSLAAIREAGADVCLIDTAPSLGNAMASALLAATHVLSPIELEAYSIQGIAKVLTVIKNVRQRNSALKFLGMLPSKVDSRNARHADHLAELRAAYPTLVLPVTVPLRISIADALAGQRPVWDIKKTSARKAAAELTLMLDYVCATLMECK